MKEFLFWLLLGLTGYSYFVYPLVLAAILRLKVRKGSKPVDKTFDRMTLIVTAFNEERRIRQKIENSLAIDYPDLEVIVASDCSTDGTDDVVRQYAGRGIRLVRAGERLGKENAQRCAIQEAKGAVLVFSDVATEIPTDALKLLARRFHDPAVGAVSSEDRFLDQAGAQSGEGAYVRYEMWLRRMESSVAGLVGLSGSFFAARREVCEEWDIHSPSDFNSALNCARRKLRAVTAPDVLGFYKDLKDPQKEYQRKVRTVLRGITAIARHPDVLSFRRFGLFAWQVWSHKIMRWAVPWLMMLLVIANLAVIRRHEIYVIAGMGQVAFYALALGAHFSDRIRGIGLMRIIYFFVQANVAVADACLRYLSGRRMTTWQPSAR